MTPERQHAMLTMTVENLLDSNVFVRSVALSFERFRGAGSVYSRDDVRKHMQLTASARGASPDQVDDEEWECWGLEDCALQRFLLAHRPQLLTELLNVLTLQDINQVRTTLPFSSRGHLSNAERCGVPGEQENICCLNTALVFFIIEDDHSTLLRAPPLPPRGLHSSFECLRIDVLCCRCRQGIWATRQRAQTSASSSSSGTPVRAQPSIVD